MKKRVLLFTFFALLVFGISGLFAQWIVYDCSVLPENADPVWAEKDMTSGLTENGVSDLFTVIDDPEIPGNKLIQVEELIGDRKESFIQELGITDPSIGVTLVMRVKASDGIIAQQGDDGNDYRYLYSSLRNGAFREQLEIDYPDLLTMHYLEFETPLPNAAQWNVYRFTLKGDETACYVNENPTAVTSGVTTKTTGDNFIKIGDASTGGLHGCVLDWVVWDLSGAHAPGEGNPLPAELTGLDFTDVGEKVTELPMSHRLMQNYPNPFNPTTEIVYELGSRESVSLQIFDINGKLVRNLVNETKNGGTYRVMWDGKDNNGNIVSTGVYLSTLQIGHSRFVKKMTLIK